MILQTELVRDAIERRRPLGKLYRSSIENLLSQYSVVDYVSAENIEIGDSIESFSLIHGLIEKHRHLSRIDISTLLSNSSKKFVAGYNQSKRFPFPFCIDLFDTFIAVEIMPNTLQPELVVISAPSATNNDSLSGVATSFEITGLFISMTPVTEVALTISIDHLLEYFRTGRGKKRLLGIF
ncbi:hypothetical protein E2F46_16235 [Luteimonas aestuarii]|uniref:Uncharacterized protein n=1 Tax=Luteimonas aestuarii TaxID=453837 RepID=A0A4R5TJ82_9GAMM|nr:hypothetical protein [Luteimonas aestuarii]TDK20348.1 hypothetical protein E2F46_16235 [Luteimonas aestuarii]